MRLLIGSFVSIAMTACNLVGAGDDPAQESPIAGEEPKEETPRASSSRDFNGDGFDDLVVGVGNGSATPMALVQLGSPQAGGGQVLQLTDDQPLARFGFSVAVAGDLNKDGFAELVVGAPSFSAGGKGRAHVYFGGPGFDAIAEVKLQRDPPVETFGRAVDGAGDFNGDGYDDLLVSAHGDDAGVGRAWIYYGGAGSTLDPVADLELSVVDLPANSFFGGDVAGAGDVNGDGFDDVLISAPGSGDGGVVFLYLGGQTPSDKPYAVMRGPLGGDNFGRSVAGLGDINGDDFDDFAIGAPEGKGRVQFYFGGASKKFENEDLVIEGKVANQNLGWAVTGVGDLDRDGLSDVMVTAPSYAYLGRPIGEAFVMYGAPNFTGGIQVTLTSSLDYFGWSANTAGDLNGDGAADLSLSSLTPGQGGKAHVYLGTRSQLLDPNADLLLTAPVNNALYVR